MYAPRPSQLEFELKLKEHELRTREHEPKQDFKPSMPVLYIVIILIILISMLLTIVGFVAIYGGFLRI